MLYQQVSNQSNIRELKGSTRTTTHGCMYVPEPERGRRHLGPRQQRRWAHHRPSRQGECGRRGGRSVVTQQGERNRTATHPGPRRDLEFPAPYPRCVPSCRGREGAGTRDLGWRGSKKGESGSACELGQGFAAMENSGGGRAIWDKRGEEEDVLE
jgi:hypothetical protein